MKKKLHPSHLWIPTLLRIICGLILVYASLDKIGHAATLMHIIEAYQVLPVALVPLASVIIPWLEFFTGLLLCLGVYWRGALLIFCTLMIVYIFALASDLIRGIELNCGCFSIRSTDMISWWTVLRDLGFLGLGLFTLKSPKTYLSFDPSDSSSKS